MENFVFEQEKFSLDLLKAFSMNLLPENVTSLNLLEVLNMTSNN